MAWEIAILTTAVFTSMMAAVVPWLRLDELSRNAWERKTAFALLVGDAFYHWWAFAHFGDGVRAPTWITTMMVLGVAGIAYAIFLIVRGYELPPLVRWPGAAALGLVEPPLLVLSFVGVHGPIPLY